MNSVIEKLNSILSDSIILKMDFRIEALGSDLEELMDFSSSELNGALLSTICVDGDLQRALQNKLEEGYFVDMITDFLTKSKESIHVTLSGFYLGLISDINGYIILKVKLTEDNSFLKKELFTKKHELDSFIYRTAHDLRGPLATIKGLVNLLKIRKNDVEVDELTSLIDVHANKLDDRLFKLLYLADVNSVPENSRGIITFSELEAALKKTIADNFQLDKAIFRLNAPALDLHGVNEYNLSQLISNMLLYIISLPVASVTRENEIAITIDFTVNNDWLEVVIKADGFLTTEKIQEAIRQPTSLYNDLLNYPFLFNYYVAQKEVMHLNALFRIDFHSEKEQVLHLSIPLNSPASTPFFNTDNRVNFGT
jgi:signal transduction histidine kinase